MERNLISGSPAPTHDLIRLCRPTDLSAAGPLPAWVETALRQAPWVVVRRGHVHDGMMPVGVRGPARQERFAAFVPAAAIAQQLSPEDLIKRFAGIEEERKKAVPALAALVRVTLLLARRDFHWGPGGSVGFEIASGLPTATPLSDLDLVLRLQHRLEPNEALELATALTNAAVPARIDVILETPGGGVSLAELATRPPRLLVRTPAGPRLGVDPWVPTINLSRA